MISPELRAAAEVLSCCRYRGDCHSDILVKESDVLATLRSVRLKAGNGDWIAFDPDRGRKVGKAVVMSPLLAIGNHDHHRACDAIILHRQAETLYAVFVELKSAANPSGYVSQFKSARCFLRYLREILHNFHGHEFPKVEERYVIFYGGPKRSLNKRPTSISKLTSKPSSSPENPMKEQVSDGGALYLRQLL